MCTRWMFNNLVDDAVITASSENAMFPASNIKDSRRTKVFRSTSNSTYVYLDFGAAEPIDTVFMVDHIFNGLGFTTASLELNSVATWTSGAPVTISITIDQDNGIAWGENGSVVNYRYAKLILTGTLGYVEVSKVFIGEQQVISALVDFGYPLNFKRDDKSTISLNRYNQAFVDQISKFKAIGGSISTMTKDEVDVLLSLDALCSNTKPFFIRFDSTEAQLLNDNDQMAGYFRLSNEMSFSLTQGGYWNTQIQMEESG